MDTITLSIHQFKRILKEVSEIACTKTLIKSGLARPIIYRTDAIKLHGATLIGKLEKLELITRRQHHMGSNYYYDIIELNEAILIDWLDLYHNGYGKTK